MNAIIAVVDELLSVSSKNRFFKLVKIASTFDFLQTFSLR
jgi:hypothetical protein